MTIVAIVAICITIISLVARIFLYKHIQRMQQRLTNLNLNNAEDFKAAVKLTYGDPVESWEDALIICSEQIAKEKSIVYDFSRWDDKKIIGVISMHPDVTMDEDGNPRINIVPKQKVFRYKDGTIIWSPQLQ